MNVFNAYKARPGRDTMVALLEAHQDTIYNLCYQVLRHPQNAQDAAQQVLMSLLEALPRISDDDHLKQWLHRAAFHVSLDLKKIQKRRREREARVATMEEPTMQDEVADEVQLHISRLDDELRTLVVEHYFEQKPLGELAAERGVSTVAVWKKLDRARERLRESLTRAGFASALPGLDPFLASLKPVAAPKGLLTKAMLSKAAGATVVGGIAVKIKTIAAATVLMLGAGGALGIAVIRQRYERRRQTLEQETARARIRPAAPTQRNTAAPAAASEKAVSAPAVEPEEIETFRTQEEYYQAFRKAIAIQEDAARWKALRRIGILRTPEQFQKAESDLRSRRGTNEFEKGFMIALWKDWTRTDFKGFLECMMRIPADPTASKEKQLAQILDLAAHWNEEAVLAYARSLPLGEGRSQLLKSLGALETTNPETVLGMAKGPERAEAMKQLFDEWGRTNPRAAAQWIDQLPADERALARLSLARGWGRFECQAAADWVREVATGQDRQSLLRAVVAGAATADPKGGVELAMKYLDGKDRWCPEMEKAIRAWGEADPSAAVRFLKTHDHEKGEEEREYFLPRLAQRWAQRDPSAALEWAETLEGEERTLILMSVSEGLATSIISNPKEALSVLDKLPASRREAALYGVMGAWAEVDPRAAADFARSRPESTVKLDQVIAQRWAQRDLEACIAWARALPDGVDRDSALQAIAITALATRAPDRGAEIAREILDSVLRDGALEQVSEQLAGRALLKAIAVTSEIQDATRRKNAQSYILGRCGSSDPQACLALLSGMQNATAVEYKAFGYSWAQTDPRAAVTWAGGLSRPELRESTLNSIFPEWVRQDRDAAQAWVTQAALPEPLRQKLVTLMPARKP